MEPREPLPDPAAELKQAVFDYIVSGTPMEDRLREELVSGDNVYLIYSFIREKQVDINDEGVVRRASQLMFEVGRHTISAHENQPLRQGHRLK